MNFQSIFPAVFLCMTLMSCTSSESADDAKILAKERLEKSTVSENSTFSIGVLAELMQEGTATTAPKTEINLISPQFPEHLLLTRDFNYAPLDKSEWEKLGIPRSAKLAFKSFHKKERSDYYLKMKDEVVTLYRRVKLDESKKALESFSPFRTIDLNNRISKEGSYTCFTADEDKNIRLSIFVSSDAKARAMRFEGDKDYTHLLYHASEMSGDGEMPTFVDQYFEFHQGRKRALFNITHAGEWDYVKYERLSDQKSITFTIDHAETIIDEAYRKTPCFEN